MALLKGRIPPLIPERYYDLEITPILPSLNGPRDAYHIVVWRNGEQVFEQTYSVRRFTGGHYDLWQTANMLQHAPDIVNQKAFFTLIPLPPEAWCKAEPQQFFLRHNSTWMDISLSGATMRGKDTCLLKVDLAVEPISGYAMEPGGRSG